MVLPGFGAEDGPPLYQVARVDGRWLRFVPLDVAGTTWMVLRNGVCADPPELLTTRQKDALIGAANIGAAARRRRPRR